MVWYKLFGSPEEARKRIPEMRVVSVFLKQADKRIFLARTADGFFAGSDACPHMGVSLATGVCTKYNEITCPWHSYRFSMKSGLETTGHDCAPIEVYPIREQPDGFFVGV